MKNKFYITIFSLFLNLCYFNQLFAEEFTFQISEIEITNNGNMYKGIKRGDIVSNNIETQCHSVFANIKYILEDSGSSWENIVDVQVFLTNMKDDFKTYNKIYAEYFKDNQPCRTTIEIKSLPTPIAIELKVIATI